MQIILLYIIRFFFDKMDNFEIPDAKSDNIICFLTDCITYTYLVIILNKTGM